MNTNYKKYLLLVATSVLSVTVGCSMFTSVKETVKEKVSGQATRNLKEVTFDTDTFPAVVLGGGVGGMTAAVYLSMANIQTMLAQGDMPGGLLTQSLSVRNWPGEIESPGAAITDKLHAQAVKRGVEVEAEKVVGVDFTTWPFNIRLVNVSEPTKTRTVKALTAIIGMGAQSNYLGIKGEKEYWSKGVTNCAVCEGSLYRGKTVCVIGGGDSAMEEASYLAGLAKKVYVFVRKDTLRAVDNRKDEVVAMPNIEVVYSTSLKEIKGNGKKVTGVVTIDNKTKETKNYQLDGVFLAIGFTPNTTIFKGQLDLTKNGYISLKQDQQTSIPGVYAVGDIVDPEYKQAVTAAGDGCRAALQAHAYLGELGYKPVMKEHEVAAKDSGSVTDEAMDAEQGDAAEQNDVVKQEKPAAARVTAEKKEAPAEEPQRATKDRGAVTDEVMETPSGYAPGVVHEMETAQEYETLLVKAKKPVIVDFYATWCGPCKAIAPLYKKLAASYGEKAIFAKVNIDHVDGINHANRIQGVPTFLFIKEGKEQNRLIGGSHTRKQFESKIDVLLK